ncbi:MAG TPA: hypothetical protein VIH93_12105 [Thermoanaerobaculia bacterium]|jgi:hypothetical protein
MSEPHLLRVDEGPRAFAALVAALGAAGMRAGWLDLAGSAGPLPPDLEAAAAAGVLRAVAAGGGRSVAVKPLKGAPVLGDLLREHFRGCALVLVRGEAAVPHLAIDGEGWRVSPPGEAERTYATADLVAALRRPRPWS